MNEQQARDWRTARELAKEYGIYLGFGDMFETVDPPVRPTSKLERIILRALRIGYRRGRPKPLKKIPRFTKRKWAANSLAQKKVL